MNLNPISWPRVGEANKIMEYNLLNYLAMLILPIHQCYHPNFVIWNAWIFETVTKQFCRSEMFEKPTIIFKNQMCPNTE
jgi:hypothetical protein